MANPYRIKMGVSPDLTCVDMNDSAVFDDTQGRRAADTLLTRVEAAGVLIVGEEMFPDLWKRAAEIKSKYRRVSLADCFGVSLTLGLNAPFWTGDRHQLQALNDAGVVPVHFFR